MASTTEDFISPDSLKPLLRGHFHQAAFFFGLGACAMLIAQAPTPLSRLAAVIYTVSLAILFGVSSLYHRISWSERKRLMMQKLDHSGIFIFIAGTVTPICLVGVRSESGEKLLALFWTLALVGILKEYFWKTAPRWSSGVFYVTMGWLAAPYLGEFQRSLGTVNSALLVAGGVIYTLGALIYAIRWPDPSPRVFGFHEIFHVLIILAGLLHYLVIYDVITSAKTEIAREFSLFLGFV